LSVYKSDESGMASMPTGFFIWGYMYPFTFIFGGPMYPLTLHLGVQRKWTAFCSFHMSSFCICFFFFLSIWNKISICCCFECIIWTVIFWCLKEIKTLATRYNYIDAGNYYNTVVLNHFHSVKILLFSSARSRDFDGLIGIELPVSIYTTKTLIDLCRFNVRSST
jgi:hypothetical protein